jgi:hypothetical protein
MKTNRQLLLTLAIAAVVGTSVLACQVPVFRFALERWQADNYELLILHEGALDEATQVRIDRLRDAKANRTANLEVQVAEVSKLRDPRLLTLWSNRSEGDKPLMVVLYPKTAMEVPDRVLDSAPFSEEAIEYLIQSPVREQIAKRLSRGESAVWVFVPSGIASKDAVALAMLNDRIAVNKARLTLPTAEELEIEPELLAKNKIPLRIDFSVVTLDRKDPREAFLLKSLIKSEADLNADDEPMAFPVFGRGRVLYALVGDGIMPQTTDTACKFMVGPCSCQVKNQNPGFDLLMNFDWDQTVEGSMISSPLPDESAAPKLLTIPPGRRAK